MEIAFNLVALLGCVFGLISIMASFFGLCGGDNRDIVYHVAFISLCGYAFFVFILIFLSIFRLFIN